MSLPYARAPHTTGSPATQPEAPNAALLIDFDNVTMGMRSDLSKELKNLLNSDIIKGKVTVQRAYADWRRYPQYIVPLSENSVDLIFAPAYGSSKKNATDIRMAIDGMELVFIRPEIGTFILLTGDSDFSSLVLKLKEYGKYVIGVGIQESSSDILVQNCDEYYSYTSLSGLRKTTDSANKPLDPWVLVEEAVKKMAARNDVMRSDRLKQVMIEIDASFDEGNFGFSKFSKFLSEAASRDLVSLRKLENGQYEIQPRGRERSEAGKSRPGPVRKTETRDRTRGEKGAGAGDGPRGGRAPVDVVGTDKQEISRKEPPQKERDVAPGTEETGGEDPLRAGYDLLKRAMARLSDGNGGGPVRDSDLKRKMLELQPSFDEGELGFGKFSRFLRQAHDHEVIDLEKREEGTYQVSLRQVSLRDEAVRDGAAQEKAPEPSSAEEAPSPEAPSRKKDSVAGGGKKESAAGGGKKEGWGLGVRRGERGRSREKEGPPPILEGQVIQPGGSAAAAPEGRVKRETEAGAAEDRTAPEQKTAPRQKTAPEQRTAPAPGGESIDPGELGLPTGRAAVIRYLTNSYKGVGKKTAETLVDTYGGDLFKVLQEDPDRLSSVVAGKRAEQLLEAWRADYQRRRERASRSTVEEGGSGRDAGEGREAGDGPEAGGRGSQGADEGSKGSGNDPQDGGPGGPQGGGQDAPKGKVEDDPEDEVTGQAKTPPKRRTRRGGRSRRQ